MPPLHSKTLSITIGSAALVSLLAALDFVKDAMHEAFPLLCVLAVDRVFA
jgi:hypothetical protein